MPLKTPPEDPHAVPAPPALIAAAVSNLVPRDVASAISREGADAIPLAATALGEHDGANNAMTTLLERGVVEAEAAPTVKRVEYREYFSVAAERVDTARALVGRIYDEPSGEDLASLFEGVFMDGPLTILRAVTCGPEAVAYLHVLLMEGPFRDAGEHTFSPASLQEDFVATLSHWEGVSDSPFWKSVCEVLKGAHRTEHAFRRGLAEALGRSPYVTDQAAVFLNPHFNPVSESYEIPTGHSFISRPRMCYEMALNILQGIKMGKGRSATRPYPDRESAVAFLSAQGLELPTF